MTAAETPLAPDPVGGGGGFTDVSGEEWFAPAVTALKARGVIVGRQDGSFSPQDLITRAEFVLLLARVLGLEDSLPAPFVDVPGSHPAAGAVGALYREKVIRGLENGHFAPEGLITREQAASYLVRALGGHSGSGLGPGEVADMDDVECELWLGGFRDRTMVSSAHRFSVAKAYQLGILRGTEEGWLYPGLPLTRAEAAVMLWRAFLSPPSALSEPPEQVAEAGSYDVQGPGARGRAVLLLETRLTALCYPCGDVDGVYDERTRDAVLAFEKVTGLPRDGVVGQAAWEELLRAQTPTPRLSEPGKRVEVDLRRQVMFLISEGAVTEVIHVSTGRAGTPTGHGKVWLKQQGWVKCSVGWMYFPCYFWPRIAIHGSSSVPTYPASHGCVRTPVWIAEQVHDWLSVGTPVDVYY